MSKHNNPKDLRKGDETITATLSRKSVSRQELPSNNPTKVEKKPHRTKMGKLRDRIDELEKENATHVKEGNVSRLYDWVFGRFYAFVTFIMLVIVNFILWIAGDKR